MKRVNKRVLLVLICVMVIFNSQSIITFANENVSSRIMKNGLQDNVGTNIEEGIIFNDTIWTKEKSPYIIKGKVQLAHEATLTIEPGVEVIGNGNDLKIYGQLLAKGTESEKIRINNLNIIGNSTNSSEFYKINLEQIRMDGGEILSPGNGPGNIFSNCKELSIGSEYDSYITNNVFYNINSRFEECVIEARTNYKNSKTYVENNSFYDEGIVLRNQNDTGNIVGRNNYWNTTNISDIKKRIYDKRVDLGVGNIIDFEPILTKPHENTPKFSKPIITAEDITLKVGQNFNPYLNVTALDSEDGDLTNKIQVVSNNVDTSKAGIYEVKYSVTDSHYVTSILTINVIVEYEIEDVNKDGIIDVEDIAIVASKYNKTNKDEQWDNQLDLNKDGIIDIFDLVIISKKLK